MSKTIFITGASRGFGRIWTEAFLKRGDKVIATARNVDTLNDLVTQHGDNILPIQLDVNNRAADFAAIAKAKAHFGTIDVLINNAGYGLFGAIEEISEQEARDQIETNVFGLLWLTQAVLPLMRQQGHGHIVQLSSVLGITTLPVLGLYNATKFAVEGLTETLAAEVAGLGIKVSLIEPNGFATDFGGASGARAAATIDAYDDVKAVLQTGAADTDIFGDPKATVDAVLQLIDNPNPPLRLFLGKAALPWVKQAYADKMASWEEWNHVAVAAHGH